MKSAIDLSELTNFLEFWYGPNANAICTHIKRNKNGVTEIPHVIISYFSMERAIFIVF